MRNRKPGSLVACWWNIVICSIITVGSAVFALTEGPLVVLGVTAIGLVLEVVFVRLLLEVLAERRAAG